MTLAVEGLNAWYGGAHVLDDVSFAVPEGGVVALLGRNGAGKSTTLKAMMGLVPRRAGRVVLDGVDLSELDTHRIVRAGLGWVPEDRRVFTGLSVEENLSVGRRPGPWTPERLYDLFPNLRELRRRPAGQMSGGEQQMLAIARTLMGNPSCLLLDEPSEGLAPRIVEHMADALTDLKRSGLTIVLSEQTLAFARVLADTAVLLEKGRVVFAGRFADLDADSDLKARHLAV